MSSIVRSKRWSSLGTANTGPMPISSGSVPATAMPTKRPSGVRPFFAATAASMTTSAAEPSESWLALPAVTTPPGSTVFSEARPSSVVSARLPSSFASVTSFWVVSPVALSVTFIVVVVGTISAS